MSYDVVNLGQKIEDLRKEKKMTIEKLSSLMEDYETSLSPSTISKYENGTINKEIGVKKIIAFSKIFNVSIDYLLDNVIIDKEYLYYILKNKLGLENSTLDIIRRITKKPKTLFGVNESKEEVNESKEKTTESKEEITESKEEITELKIFNYIISKTDLISLFLEEVQNVIIKEREITSQKEIVKKSRRKTSKIEIKQLEEAKNEYILEREDILSKKIIKSFRDYIKLYNNSNNR